MVTIYYTDSFKIQGKQALSDLLSDLPRDLQRRALRFHSPRDAYNFVLGRLLLKKGLIDLNIDQKFEDVVYQENGKPLLSEVYFNISHSDHLVVCALSTQAVVGIDVEVDKTLELRSFHAYFTTKEWADINGATHPQKRFYWYWTRKEAIIKALGVNLSYLHDIEIDSTSSIFKVKGENWFLRDLDFGSGCFGALCSQKEEEEVRMVFVGDF